MLKKLYLYLKSKSVDVDIDEDDEYLHIHYGMAIIYFEHGEFNLSFEVNMDPTNAATLTSLCIGFALEHDSLVSIYEPYAHVLDEEENIKEVLFGDEANEYHQTGQLPHGFELKDKDQDDQSKLDSILDQIGKKGMKSLKKDQKRFLINYSKK